MKTIKIILSAYVLILSVTISAMESGEFDKACERYLPERPIFQSDRSSTKVAIESEHDEDTLKAKEAEVLEALDEAIKAVISNRIFSLKKGDSYCELYKEELTRLLHMTESLEKAGYLQDCESRNKVEDLRKQISRIDAIQNFDICKVRNSSVKEIKE